MLKFEVYPEFAPKNHLTDFDAKPVVTPATSEDVPSEDEVKEPKETKGNKTKAPKEEK